MNYTEGFLSKFAKVSDVVGDRVGKLVNNMKWRKVAQAQTGSLFAPIDTSAPMFDTGNPSFVIIAIGLITYLMLRK